jgi:hypothetical protein
LQSAKRYLQRKGPAWHWMLTVTGENNTFNFAKTMPTKKSVTLMLECRCWTDAFDKR